MTIACRVAWMLILVAAFRFGGALALNIVARLN
jgi:hypothetical protein